VQKEAVKKSWGHGGQVRVSIVSQGSSSNGASSSGAVTTSDDASNVESANDVQSGGSPVEEIRDFDGGTNRKDSEEEVALWTPVIIRGDPCGAIAAAKLLLPLLITNPPTGAQSDDDGIEKNDVDYSADMDDVVLDVPIHRSRHAAIIGKKGLTIAALSADHNVRIMVPHRNHSVHDKTSSPNTAAPSPSNINIVQLEGQLENVERCLASMLKVVCGTHSSNNNSSSYGNGDTGATENSNAKQDSNVHNAKIEPSNSNMNRKLTIATTSNQHHNSKKEPKFTEITITVPHELSYFVPSLAKIRSIGKSTNSVIRRKRLDGNVSSTNTSVTNNSNTVGTANGSGEETTAQEKADSGDETPATCTFTTQLIVSGRTEFVKNAASQLEKMLTPSGTVADVNSDRHGKGRNAIEDQEAGKKELNESGSSDKCKEDTDFSGDPPRQKSTPGKRRTHGGRGGGRTGNRGGKKRGGGRGGNGNRGEGSITAGNLNSKE